jgi:hypothetical protein
MRSRSSSPASARRRNRTGCWPRCCSPTSWGPLTWLPGWATGSGTPFWTSITSWCASSCPGSGPGDRHGRGRLFRHVRRPRPGHPLRHRDPGRAAQSRPDDPGRAAHRRGRADRRQGRGDRRAHRGQGLRAGRSGRGSGVPHRGRPGRGLGDHLRGPRRAPAQRCAGVLAAVRRHGLTDGRDWREGLVRTGPVRTSQPLPSTAIRQPPRHAPHRTGSGARSSLIRSLTQLRPQTFGAHHREQPAEVTDPLDLRRTQPHRLGKRVGTPSRLGRAACTAGLWVARRPVDSREPATW